MFTNEEQTDNRIGALEAFDTFCVSVLDPKSTLTIGDTSTVGTFKAQTSSLISAKIYCTEDISLPIHLSYIKTERPTSVARADVMLRSASLRLGFSDAHNKGFAHTIIHQDCKILQGAQPLEGFGVVTSIIKNENGVVRGHISYKPEFSSFLFAAAGGFGGKQQQLDEDAFVFSASCYVPWFEGIAQALFFEDTQLYGRTRILPDMGIVTLPNTSTDDGTNKPPEDPDDTVYSFGSVQLSVSGALYDNNQSGIKKGNGFCRLYITDGNGNTEGPYWIGGKHLVFRHAKLSNLRVVNKTGRTLTMEGVLDV